MYKTAFPYRQELQQQMRSLEKLSKNGRLSGAEFFDKALPLLKTMARDLDLLSAQELQPKDPISKLMEAVPSFDTGRPAPTYFEEGMLAWTQDFGEELTDGEADIRKALDHDHLRAMLQTGLEKKLLPATVHELLTTERWMPNLERDGGYTQYEVEMFYACLAHMRLSFRPKAPEYCEDVLVLDALAPSEEGSDSDYVPDDDASENNDSDSDSDAETEVELTDNDANTEDDE